MKHTLIHGARVAAVPVALAAAMTVLVIAFAWPTSHIGPRGVVVAVSGSPDFVRTLSNELESAAPGDFEVRVAVDRADGEKMLRENDADGLIDETASGPQLVLASAGRPAVAQMLTEVESRLVGSTAPSPVVQGVPGPPDDPHSAVLTSASLPTIIGALAAGVALTVVAGTRSIRIVRILLLSVLTGLGLTLVMNTWLGALTGDWWASAGCYALAVGAVTAAINGLQNVLGRFGGPLVAAIIMLVGNPLSGAASAPELLPDGWSTLGQALPPGALASALRDVGFYGGDGAAAHVLVLAAWAMVGVLLLAVGRPGRVGARAAVEVNDSSVVGAVG